MVLTGTGALPRDTLRASLQRVTRVIATRQVCPLYQRLQRCGFNGTGALPLNTLRASLQRVTRVIATRQVCPLYQRLQRCGFNGDGPLPRGTHPSLPLHIATHLLPSYVDILKSPRGK